MTSFLGIPLSETATNLIIPIGSLVLLVLFSLLMRGKQTTLKSIAAGIMVFAMFAFIPAIGLGHAEYEKSGLVSDFTFQVPWRAVVASIGGIVASLLYTALFIGWLKLDRQLQYEAHYAVKILFTGICGSIILALWLESASSTMLMSVYNMVFGFLAMLMFWINLRMQLIFYPERGFYHQLFWTVVVTALFIIFYGLTVYYPTDVGLNVRWLFAFAAFSIMLTPFYQHLWNKITKKQVSG